MNMFKFIFSIYFLFLLKAIYDKKLSNTTTTGSYLIGNQQTSNPLGRLVTSPSLTRSNLLLILPASPLITSLTPADLLMGDNN